MIKCEDVLDQFAELGLDMDEVTAFFTVLSADDGAADYNEFLALLEHTSRLCSALGLSKGGEGRGWGEGVGQGESRSRGRGRRLRLDCFK